MESLLPVYLAIHFSVGLLALVTLLTSLYWEVTDPEGPLFETRQWVFGFALIFVPVFGVIHCSAIIYQSLYVSRIGSK